MKIPNKIIGEFMTLFRSMTILLAKFELELYVTYKKHLISESIQKSMKLSHLKGKVCSVKCSSITGSFLRSFLTSNYFNSTSIGHCDHFKVL